jgi:catechol 2,3-dioxygenase-like lactoylglutathione lyase family enzyme
MSRIQLALNVSNIDAAVAFYSRLFSVNPAKTRPGYANFAIAEPALKLVLIEDAQKAGTLNHLGVEMENSNEVEIALEQLNQSGLATELQKQVDCCYALQDKGWVEDPDGAPWEIYTVLEDSEIHLPNLSRDQKTACGAQCCQ